MFENVYMRKDTGELVTVVFTDGLYIKTSDGRTSPCHVFNQEYEFVYKGELQ